MVVLEVAGNFQSLSEEGEQTNCTIHVTADFVVDVGRMLSAPEVTEFQVPTAGGKVGFGFQPGEELKVEGISDPVILYQECIQYE